MTKRGMGADASHWKLGDASSVSCFRAAYSSGKDFSRMLCSALVTFSSRPACSTCTHVILTPTKSNSHPLSCLCNVIAGDLVLHQWQPPGLLYLSLACVNVSIKRCWGCSLHRSAHGAAAGVVHAARKAGAAEGVAARRRHWLVQQLHAQAAVGVLALRHPPACI